MGTSSPLPAFRPVRVKKPTHTATALRVHSLTADASGAYLTVVGVWSARFPTVADACAAIEELGAEVCA